jgi:hypothetical protein
VEPVAETVIAETAAVEPAPMVAAPEAAEAPPMEATEAPVAAAAPPPPAPMAPAPLPPPASPDDSLAALRLALPGHFEKAPNRPLYLRQIRQVLRAAGCFIDERSGFRGLLDLLHQAQREGWVRLHRDRKGVWRVFPAGPAPAVAAATPAEVGVAVEAVPGLESSLEPDLGPGLDPDLEPDLEPDLLMPVETDVNWEMDAVPEEIIEADEIVERQQIAEPEAAPLPPPVAIEEVVAAEPPAEPPAKSRKPRALKTGARNTKRKPSTRRKTKEPPEPTGE